MPAEVPDGDATPSIAIGELPADAVIRLVAFWRRMDRGMRELRDSTPLPRTAVTLPDEFDEIVAAIYDDVERQARDATARGDESVAIALPITPDLRALAAWAKERMELLEGLVRAGVVQGEWEEPLTLTIAFWRSTCERLGV